jgi:hypothetical protein
MTVNLAYSVVPTNCGTCPRATAELYYKPNVRGVWYSVFARNAVVGSPAQRWVTTKGRINSVGIGPRTDML